MAILPIDLYEGSPTSIATTVASEAIAMSLHRHEGRSQTDEVVVGDAWKIVKGSLWSGRLVAQRAYDRMNGWSPALVVRASKAKFWLFRDETMLPRLQVVRRTAAGPWLYPLDPDSYAISLLCFRDVAVARQKLIQIEGEYEQRMTGLVGLPMELVEESARQQRARALQEARLNLTIDSVERALKELGVDMATSKVAPVVEPKPFSSDRESWTEGRRMAGQLLYLRGCNVACSDDPTADMEILRYCARLRASSDGVSLTPEAGAAPQRRADGLRPVARVAPLRVPNPGR